MEILILDRIASLQLLYLRMPNDGENQVIQDHELCRYSIIYLQYFEVRLCHNTRSSVLTNSDSKRGCLGKEILQSLVYIHTKRRGRQES